MTLITGATGTVGSEVVKRIVCRTHLRPHMQFVQGDLEVLAKAHFEFDLEDE